MAQRLMNRISRMLITNGQARARGRLKGQRQRSPRPVGRAWAGSYGISLRCASTAHDQGILPKEIDIGTTPTTPQFTAK